MGGSKGTAGASRTQFGSSDVSIGTGGNKVGCREAGGGFNPEGFTAGTVGECRAEVTRSVRWVAEGNGSGT